MMLEKYKKALEKAQFIRRTGQVTRSLGLVLEAAGPAVFLGERCDIYYQSQCAPLHAEVVGIKEGKVLLMPFGDIRGIREGSEVVATGNSVRVPVGEHLLGRVIDAFGQPLDNKPIHHGAHSYPLYAQPVNPLLRPRIKKILETGVKSIDTLLTIGQGQRMGIFAGSGVGKSTLLGMIARHMKADVNVIALIGERGREVLEFIEQTLGESGLKRSVVIAATSDQPALVRTHAALAATAISEYFRDQGRQVLLTMDSVTRFAMAQREIGLAVGEPPTARGYTPSVFALLPKLLERGGTSNSGGSITGLYTVLVEADDLNDPVSDHLRAILDGHIVLSRDLANQGHYPSIDIMQSNSRLMPQLLDTLEMGYARKAKRLMSIYHQSKDMIDIGAYRAGHNMELDQAIKIMPQLEQFLNQSLHDNMSRSQAQLQLRAVIDKVGIA